MTFYIFFFCVSLGLLCCCCCCWFEGRRGGRVKNDSNKLRVFWSSELSTRQGGREGQTRPSKTPSQRRWTSLSKCWKLLSVSIPAVCFTFAIVGKWVKWGALSRASWITKSQFRRFPLIFDTLSFRFLLSTAWRLRQQFFPQSWSLSFLSGGTKKCRLLLRFDARVDTTYLLSSLAGRASRVIIKKASSCESSFFSLLSYFSKRSSVCVAGRGEMMTKIVVDWFFSSPVLCGRESFL